jgi:catechol 2,3-dioxygenase-like lactoylglutathione lyase family enzyme
MKSKVPRVAEALKKMNLPFASGAGVQPAGLDRRLRRPRGRNVRTTLFYPNVVFLLLLLLLPTTTAFAGVTVDSIGITVSDLDRAVEFYSNVLSFEKVSETEVAGTEYEQLQGVFGARMRIARMRLGAEHIELIDYLAPEGRPVPVDFQSNDRWFQHIAIIVSNMDQAYQWLRKHKVQHASTGPQLLPAWNKNAGGISAFYFRDPDGHHLEILNFPPGKGDPKWHRATDRLFLGIDHTAIVVGSTGTSLKFYKDTLGFTIAGESENYGIEQERLNNIFGARLHITSMKPDAGPSIEFLEYLAPRTGRLLPADSRTNDLINWQTKIIAGSAEAFWKKLNGAVFVSPGVINMNGNALNFRKGFLVRDPDGHVMQIVER